MRTPDAAPELDQGGRTTREVSWPRANEPLGLTRIEIRELAHATATAWGAPEGKADVLAEDMSSSAAQMCAERVATWPDRPDLPGVQNPDPLPLDALPPVLKGVVSTVAESVQVDPSMPAGLVLATVSVAVADRVVVRPDVAHTSERAQLYVVPVAPPAARKSPVYAPVISPLREWEDR